MVFKYAGVTLLRHAMFVFSSSSSVTSILFCLPFKTLVYAVIFFFIIIS